MLTFPQLSTGCLAQAPFKRVDRVRRVLLRREDGSWTNTLRDASAGSIHWELPLRGLSDEEQSALQSFFRSCRGALSSFLFLDPADNLLRWSEDLTNAVWTSDAGVTVATGVEDAFGNTAASTVANGTAGSRTLYQSIAAPSTLQYCYSGWIRSTSAVDIFAQSAGASASLRVEAGTEWARFQLPAKLNVGSGSIQFGFALPANGSASVCGLQVEAQPAASGYKRTRSAAGVYPNTRFEQDSLSIQADGVNDYSTQVRLVSRV